MKTGLNRLRPRTLKELLVVLATASLGAAVVLLARRLRKPGNDDWMAGDVNHVPTGTSSATPRPTASQTAATLGRDLADDPRTPAEYGEQPSRHEDGAGSSAQGATS